MERECHVHQWHCLEDKIEKWCNTSDIAEHSYEYTRLDTPNEDIGEDSDNKKENKKE